LKKVSFEDIYGDAEIKEYIRRGHELLGVFGYTDHSEAHTMKVAKKAYDILKELGFPERECELGKIAGYVHDIGNVINRSHHALTGAVIAERILSRLGMDPAETATVIAAVGNHDENFGVAVSAVSAAVIIADKADVHRTRVRNKDFATFDIHDRVNYAVESCSLVIDGAGKSIELRLRIDDSICPVIDYFEIFLSRMLMSKKAAQFLGVNFMLNINGAKLL